MTLKQPFAGRFKRMKRFSPAETFQSLLGLLEQLLYGIIALILLVTAGYVILSNIENIFYGPLEPSIKTATSLLDGVLFIFIIAELFHTLRSIISNEKISVVPFLSIGLIAIVRRLLVLTAEGKELAGSPLFFSFLAELGLLAVLIVALTFAISRVRKSERASMEESPSGA
jgi:uncharacterized membrane protein (DUF373 family)